MVANEVLYTDGQDIVVTPVSFQVKGTDYKLLGITKHGMAVIRGVRWPGILILLLGMMISLLGTAGLIPASLLSESDIVINGKFITANKLAIWAGLSLAIIGLLSVLLAKERYAVRIATAEGEKNVVVSKKQEYVNQIINALNRAFMVIDVKKSHMNKTVYL